MLRRVTTPTTPIANRIAESPITWSSGITLSSSIDLALREDQRAHDRGREQERRHLDEQHVVRVERDAHGAIAAEARRERRRRGQRTRAAHDLAHREYAQ